MFLVINIIILTSPLVPTECRFVGFHTLVTFSEPILFVLYFLSPFGNNIVLCKEFCTVCMDASANNILFEWILHFYILFGCLSQ